MFLIIMVSCHAFVHMADRLQAILLIFIPDRASCLVPDLYNPVSLIPKIKGISGRSHDPADMCLVILDSEYA